MSVVSCIEEGSNSLPPDIDNSESITLIPISDKDDTPDMQTRNMALYNGLDEGSAEDRTISTFRVLIFNSNGLVYNKYTENTTQPFSIELAQDTYDFVFIGNEKSDPALSTSLSSFGGTLNELMAKSFSSDAFASGKNIPMTHMERNVKILGSGRYQTNGGSPQNGPWTVILVRLGIRVDLMLETDVLENRNSFTGLEIHNIPQTVPLFASDLNGDPIYNSGTYAASRFIPVTEGDGFYQVGSTNKYQWIKDRIILPSKLFNPKTDKNKAVLFKTKYTDESSILQEVAPLGPWNTDTYITPRNHYFKFKGIVGLDNLNIHLQVNTWGSSIPGWGGIPEWRELNVERTHITVNAYQCARIHFSSNQSDVKLENFWYPASGKSGTAAYVSGTFHKLPLDNFVYDYDPATGQGNGYVDISLEPWRKESMDRYLYLNAGGLIREIKVTYAYTSEIPYLNTSPYVGAFWRHDQLGERLIALRQDDATWSAEVEYPGYSSYLQVPENNRFVVLEAGLSADPGIGTDNPGDAEAFPVAGNKQELTNMSGAIFFRIGLTGYYDPDKVRYARIKLTINNIVYYLYVRQGEAADYVFSPTENYDGNKQRVNAVKFSPYNLTVKRNAENAGWSEVTINPASTTDAARFVDYPTMVGYLFPWNNSKKAYSPIAGNVSGFLTSPGTGAWDSDNNEICPSGYRRPNDGETSIYASKDSTIADVYDSEIRQSLWEEPPMGFSREAKDNTLFGFYADGYFDRRKLNSHIANAYTVKYATRGRVFFNKSTYASVFFPLGGTRTDAGAPGDKAVYGSYWTSSATSAGFAIRIVVSNGDGGVYSIERQNGVCIRCIKK